MILLIGMPSTELLISEPDTCLKRYVSIFLDSYKRRRMGVKGTTAPLSWAEICVIQATFLKEMVSSGNFSDCSPDLFDFSGRKFTGSPKFEVFLRLCP